MESAKLRGLRACRGFVGSWVRALVGVRGLKCLVGSWVKIARGSKIFQWVQNFPWVRNVPKIPIRYDILSILLKISCINCVVGGTNMVNMVNLKGR